MDLDPIKRTRRSYVAVALATALASLAWSAPAPDRVADGAWPPDPYPDARHVAAARAFASSAPGAVSFAVMDPVAGVRGLDPDAQFSSASVSKALLLAAELRRLRDQDEPLDEGTRALLESMITISDNDAASAIYSRVGDEGMREVAEAAGMRNFEVTPGYWGGAQVTAADLARFYLRLERNLVGPHGGYGKRLLAAITSSQRWGIPAAAGPGWRVYFKGGWRPAGATENSGSVTHQAALLVHRGGRRVAIAILTDQSPGTTSYGTLEGISGRLLAGDPEDRSWPYP
jgi:hypothetical protein